MAPETNARFTTGKTQWAMLVLLFAWSMAQPLAVIDSVPEQIRFELFFWKNILGVVTIALGAFVILAKLAQRRYPPINKILFFLSLPFAFFSLFNMLFRGHGTSIEEQILYFLWPFALFVIFPAFFPTDQERRKGLAVILLANMIALIYAIVPYASQENIGNWLDYKYRVHFGFLQPNIYSASWAAICVCLFYFSLVLNNQRRRRFFMILSLAPLAFIFLARSESILLFCLGMLLYYYFMGKGIDARLRAAALLIGLALAFIPSVAFVTDANKLDNLTSGRIALWHRSLELNMGNVGLGDYLTGQASLQSGKLDYTGGRLGFYAVRAQSDNSYLAIFLQNGLIGFILYLMPLVAMFRLISHRRRLARGLIRTHYTWVFGLWFGVFLTMWGLDVIPSFGNVTNILLFVASAPALVSDGVRDRIAVTSTGR